MRQTDNLNLTLLDRSDNMNWEEGVNKNFEKLDLASDVFKRIALRAQLIIGPAGSSTELVDLADPTATQIQNAVEAYQKENKTLIVSQTGVSVTYDDFSSYFTLTVSGRYTSNYMGAQTHAGYLVYGNGAFLGYVVTARDGMYILDRRIASGTYNIEIYRAKPLRITFLPGTYYLGYKGYGTTVSRWGALGIMSGDCDTLPRYYTVSGTGLTPTATTTITQAPDFFSASSPHFALLHLNGDVSIEGNGAIIQSGTPKPSSTRNHPYYTISLTGCKQGSIRDLTMEDSDTRSGGSCITSNFAQLYIAECLQTEFENLNLTTEFYSDMNVVINHCVGCTFRQFLLSTGAANDLSAGPRITRCVKCIFEDIRDGYLSYYRSYYFFYYCVECTIRGIGQYHNGYTGELELYGCTHCIVSGLMSITNVDLDYCVGIQLSGITGSINCAYCAGIHYGALTIASATTSNSSNIGGQVSHSLGWTGLIVLYQAVEAGDWINSYSDTVTAGYWYKVINPTGYFPSTSYSETIYTIGSSLTKVSDTGSYGDLTTSRDDFDASGFCWWMHDPALTTLTANQKLLYK